MTKGFLFYIVLALFVGGCHSTGMVSFEPDSRIPMSEAAYRGYKDACRTAYILRDRSLQFRFMKKKFGFDPKYMSNPEYRAAWSDSYTYCALKISYTTDVPLMTFGDFFAQKGETLWGMD